MNDIINYAAQGMLTPFVHFSKFHMEVEHDEYPCYHVDVNLDHGKVKCRTLSWVHGIIILIPIQWDWLCLSHIWKANAVIALRR